MDNLSFAGKGFIFIILLAAVVYCESTTFRIYPRPLNVRLQAVSDSDNLKKGTGGTSPRSVFSEDSILKSLRFWVETVNITDLSAQAMENINALTVGRYSVMRDSAFVLRDSGCVKILARLGVTGAPDTIIWWDSCTVIGACTPLIGDGDRIYKNICDSIRIRTWGLQITSAWEEDVNSGLVKDFVIRMDTIVVPLIFQVFTARGTFGSQADSVTGTRPIPGGAPPPGTKWFVVPYYASSARGFPIGWQSDIRSVAWNMRSNSQVSTGGRDRLYLRNMPAGKQLFVLWVTNPASRTGGNNRTKLSFYSSDLIAGAIPTWSAMTHIGIMELDDVNIASADPDPILVTLIVHIAMTRVW